MTNPKDQYFTQFGCHPVKKFQLDLIAMVFDKIAGCFGHEAESFCAHGTLRPKNAPLFPGFNQFDNVTAALIDMHRSKSAGFDVFDRISVDVCADQRQNNRVKQIHNSRKHAI